MNKNRFKKKKATIKKKSIFTILLIIALALAIIFSRAYRSYQRIPDADIHQKEHTVNHVQEEKAEQEKSDEIMQENHLPTTNILLGKHSRQERDSLLTLVHSGYGNREGLYMHKEAYEAFKKMHAAASEGGVQLTIISAFRSFDHQKRIWENKWNGVQSLHGNINATSIIDPSKRAKEVLRFSAMPGTSRHHWGTDIDINSLDNNYFREGKGKLEYEWLSENASYYGFCQPYTVLGQRDNQGYEEEKWHWSFIPVARLYLEIFADSVDYEHIRGFDGWQTAQELDVINNYVLAIDAGCKKHFQ